MKITEYSPSNTFHPARRLASVAVLLVSLALMAAGSLAADKVEVEQLEPADGTTVERPVRALRVWFDKAPDPAASEFLLEGPNGSLEVTGIHTMGEDDLMGRVVGTMPDGEYTATWSITDGDETQTGQWTFILKRPPPADGE